MRLFLTCSNFNNIISEDNSFWRQKFYYDYGRISFTEGSWKQLYRCYQNVWNFGYNYCGGLGYEYKYPKRQCVPAKIKQISIGGSHTIIIDWSVKTDR